MPKPVGPSTSRTASGRKRAPRHPQLPPPPPIPEDRRIEASVALLFTPRLSALQVRQAAAQFVLERQVHALIFWHDPEGDQVCLTFDLPTPDDSEGPTWAGAVSGACAQTFPKVQAGFDAASGRGTLRLVLPRSDRTLQAQARQAAAAFSATEREAPAVREERLDLLQTRYWADGSRYRPAGGAGPAHCAGAVVFLVPVTDGQRAAAQAEMRRFEEALEALTPLLEDLPESPRPLRCATPELVN